MYKSIKIKTQKRRLISKIFQRGAVKRLALRLMLNERFTMRKRNTYQSMTAEHEKFILFNGDAIDAYDYWDSPDTIVSDGAYGLGKFPGEPKSCDGLVQWYAPHIKKWSELAKPSTTLWFFNSEKGWATVHNEFLKNGWQFEVCHIWNKGIAHVAGNVNSSTVRRFPVVTEVCVLYSRVPKKDGVHLKEWLRSEWQRTGLPLNDANKACGVANAATRKYLTQDDLWYFPPGDMLMAMAKYAEKHGAATEIPYFSIDNINPITKEAWDALRYTWNHQHGYTNVWDVPALHGAERIKVDGESLHANQKPLQIMNLILEACTVESDVVWEPFGGMCSLSAAAISLGRRPFAAECHAPFYDASLRRLNEIAANLSNQKKKKTADEESLF